MNTDYNKQATDFLNATSTSFQATFKKHDFYFDGDKEQNETVFLFIFCNYFFGLQTGKK